jgi:hypothetical protein
VANQQGRLLRWPDWMIAAALAVSVMAATWYWRAALIPIDPWDYVEGARNFPNGVWNDVGLSRWGMVGPLMVFASWWGDAEATYYAYPVLAAGLLAAVLYLLAARLVNRATGVAAALVTCAFPVVFVHLSRGYPDLIAIAFVGAALLCLLLARDAGRGWRWVLWLLGAGFCVGWGFEVRELTVFAWPALAVALVRVGRPVRSALLFAILPLVTLATDVYLSSRYFGDPLLKIHALTGNSIDQSSVAADAIYLGHDRWWYLTIAFQMVWDRTGGPSMLFAAAIGFVGGALLWRRLSPTWLWGTSVALLLLLAGGFLRPSAPAIRLDIIRYSLAWLVPLILTGVCVVGLVISRARGWRRWAAGGLAVVLAACVVVPGVKFVTRFEGLVTNGGSSLRELGDYLATQPDIGQVSVWSDWGTQRLAPVYSADRFGTPKFVAGDYRSLNRLLREPAVSARKYPQAGDIVVVYSKGDDTCYHCAQALLELESAYGPFPLSGWEQVFTSSAGNLTAYRLPADYEWPTISPGTQVTSGAGAAEHAEDGDEAP